MVKVTITADESGYEKISEKMPKIKQRTLNLSGQEMLRNLSLNSPEDEGLLKQWFFSKVSLDDIEIRTPAKYAIFPNDGTGIYGTSGKVIKPKTGKALRFKPGKKWKGKVNKDGFVYLRQSKGQKGQKFVEKSIQQTKAKLPELFIKAVNEA